jgi:hypothetical protein
MPTDQSSKPIPGIPLGALAAIDDSHVRDVLLALVSTHNVRNNLAGLGNEAFITTRQALEATRTSASSETPIAPQLLARYMNGAGGGPFGPGSLSDPMGTIHLTLDRATSFYVNVDYTVGGGSDSTTRVEIHGGPGVVLLSQSDKAMGGYWYSRAAAATFRLEAGDHALTIHFGNNGSGSYSLGGWGMLLMPAAG